jgi:hypothetical protein
MSMAFASQCRFHGSNFGSAILSDFFAVHLFAIRFSDLFKAFEVRRNSRSYHLSNFW